MARGGDVAAERLDEEEARLRLTMNRSRMFGVRGDTQPGGAARARGACGLARHARTGSDCSPLAARTISVAAQSTATSTSPSAR